MDWSEESIDKILEKLPKRTKSYLEYKTKKMKQAQSKEIDVEVYPKTVHEMEDIINAAIDRAKGELTDLKMFEYLNALHDDWIKIKNSFIIMSVLMASLKHRDKEGIEKFLKESRGEK
jgi:hypothetical protein